MDTLLEQATPRPWRVLEDDDPEGTGILGGGVEGSIDEGQVAFVERWSGAFDDKANAELIVRAVNAYEPLVKALRKIAAKMDAWEAECRQAGVWLATDPDARMAAWVRDAAHAALATVESSPEREGGE